MPLSRLFLVAIVLSCAGLAPRAAMAKAPFRMGKISCVFVRFALVEPITGRFDGDGKIRCTIAVTKVAKVGDALPLVLSLDQPGDNPGDKPRHLESKLEVNICDGNYELELPYHDDVNTCAPYTFTFTLGKQKKKLEVSSECPD